MTDDAHDNSSDVALLTKHTLPFFLLLEDTNLLHEHQMTGAFLHERSSRQKVIVLACAQGSDV